MENNERAPLPEVYVVIAHDDQTDKTREVKVFTLYEPARAEYDRLKTIYPPKMVTLAGRMLEPSAAERVYAEYLRLFTVTRAGFNGFTLDIRENGIAVLCAAARGVADGRGTGLPLTRRALLDTIAAMAGAPPAEHREPHKVESTGMPRLIAPEDGRERPRFGPG